MTWRLYVYGQRLFAGNYITAVLDIPLGIAAMLGTVRTCPLCFGRSGRPGVDARIQSIGG